MFKATDNQEKLENMNIDDVLEHAEDHDTTENIGGAQLGGEDFLRQFEIADYKADVSWDAIIPKEDRERIEEEERVLQEQVEALGSAHPVRIAKALLVVSGQAETVCLQRVDWRGEIRNESLLSGLSQQARVTRRGVEDNSEVGDDLGWLTLSRLVIVPSCW